MSVKVRAALEVDPEALIQPQSRSSEFPCCALPRRFHTNGRSVYSESFFAAQLIGPKSAIGIAEGNRAPVGYVWFEVQTRPGRSRLGPMPL